MKPKETIKNQANLRKTTERQKLKNTNKTGKNTQSHPNPALSFSSNMMSSVGHDTCTMIIVHTRTLIILIIYDHSTCMYYYHRARLYYDQSACGYNDHSKCMYYDRSSACTMIIVHACIMIIVHARL